MRISLVIAVLGFVSASPGHAAEVTAGLDMVSAYVFRGVTYNDGPCLQPSVEFGSGAFTFNLWLNFDLKDYEDYSVKAGDFSEVDLTLSYGPTVGPMEISLGVMQFLFPEAGPNTSTRELFVTAEIPIVDGLGGSFYIGYDFDLIEDFYASIGLSYALPLEAFSLTVSSTAGYAGEKASAGGVAGLHELEAKLEGEYPLSESLSLGGFLAYTRGLDSEVLPEQDVEVFGGLTLGFSF